jgi:hypothetical protein
MFAWIYCEQHGVTGTAIGLASADLVCNTVSDNIRNTMALKGLRFVPAVQHLSEEKGIVRGLLNKGSAAFVHSFAFWACFKATNDALHTLYRSFGLDPDTLGNKLSICALDGLAVTAGMMPVEHFRSRCTGRGTDLRKYGYPEALRIFGRQIYSTYLSGGLFQGFKAAYRGGASYAFQNVLTATVTIAGLEAMKLLDVVRNRKQEPTSSQSRG